MSRSEQIKFMAGGLWLRAVYGMLGATFFFCQVIFRNVLSVGDVPFLHGAQASC